MIKLKLTTFISAAGKVSNFQNMWKCSCAIYGSTFATLINVFMLCLCYVYVLCNLRTHPFMWKCNLRTHPISWVLYKKLHERKRCFKCNIVICANICWGVNKIHSISSFVSCEKVPLRHVRGNPHNATLVGLVAKNAVCNLCIIVLVRTRRAPRAKKFQ